MYVVTLSSYNKIIPHQLLPHTHTHTHTFSDHQIQIPPTYPNTAEQSNHYHCISIKTKSSQNCIHIITANTFKHHTFYMHHSLITMTPPTHYTHT